MTDFRALCEELADNLHRYQCWYIEDNGYGLHDLEALLRRTHTALAEQPVGPTPIPMADRLPCLEDCDAEGRCWFHSTGRAWCDWYLLKASSATDTETHWLPANALPTPEATND